MKRKFSIALIVVILVGIFTTSLSGLVLAEGKAISFIQNGDNAEFSADFSKILETETAEEFKTQVSPYMLDFSGGDRVTSDAYLQNAEGKYGKTVMTQSLDSAGTGTYFGSDFTTLQPYEWKDFTLTLSLMPKYKSVDWTWGKILFRAQDNRLAQTNAPEIADAQTNSLVLNYSANMMWLTSNIREVGQEFDTETYINASTYPLKSQDGVYFDIKIIAKGDYIAVFVSGEKIMENNLKELGIADTFSKGIFSFVTWQTAFNVQSINITSAVSDADIQQKVAIKCSNESINLDSPNFDNLNEWNLSGKSIQIGNDDTGAKAIINNNTNTSATTYAYFGDASNVDTYLRFNMQLGNIDDYSFVKVLFKANNINNNYNLMLKKGEVILSRVSIGASKEISKATIPLQVDKNYKICITSKNNIFNVWIDGVNVIKDAKDSTYNSNSSGNTIMGYCGFYSFGTPYIVNKLVVEKFTTQLPNTGEPTSPSEPEKPEEPTKDNSTLWIILGSIFGVLVIGGGVTAVILIRKKKYNNK